MLKYAGEYCEYGEGVQRGRAAFDLCRRHLHELVTAQYKSVERAMIGQGDFVVADSFKHHCISYCRWQGLSEEQRSQQLRKPPPPKK